MNYLFSIILVCILIYQTNAQPQSFFDHTWKVEAQSILHNNEHIYSYHKDSLSNHLDYSGLAFKFMENGTYERMDGDTTFIGTYKIFPQIDSIEIDEDLYYLASLTDDKIVIQSILLQLSQDLTSIDTAYVYLSLYPYIVTGVYKSAAETILLYPNPATDELRVESTGQSVTIGTIRLLTIYGNVLSTSVRTDHSYFSFDTSHLPEGIYFIEVLDNRTNRICVKKFSRKTISE